MSAEYREDYYRVLGLTHHASSDEIRQSWLRLISYWHPDRASHQAAEERAKELNRAYQVLSNPVSRADYDDWYQEQGFDRQSSNQRAEAKREAESAGATSGSGWEAPPHGYHHHSGLDPLTGLRRRMVVETRRMLGYLCWAGGLLVWLILLTTSLRLVDGDHPTLLQTAILAVDVMALWTWLFAIAGINRDHSQGEWWRFWLAELLGALTATSATLLLAAVGILAALLLSPAGFSTFRSVGWLGAGMGMLALAGALGAFTFRWIWQRWQELVASRWSREQVH
ncbi:MAG: J domain-containing protein [Candidatus Dormibacteraceae bacterium]